MVTRGSRLIFVSGAGVAGNVYVWYNVPHMSVDIARDINIFKALAAKSAYRVGLDFGFDKLYKDSRAIRNAIQNIYTRIKNNPEQYGLGQDVVTLVETSMAQRKAALVGSQEPTIAEKSDDRKDIKSLVTSIRDKTFRLIDKKLDRLSNSKKRLDSLSFKDLGIIAGIAFDKTQILKGEATENIAVLAKISPTMTADEAIQMALRVRESHVETNTGRG